MLRTLAFHKAWDYAPTLPEFIQTLDCGDDAPPQREAILGIIGSLAEDGSVTREKGRITLGSGNDIRRVEERDPYQPRKRRRARQVARWLARLDGVRFVALANTTALGSARDGADLDFFIIVKAGTIWTTRFFSGSILKLFGLRPRPGHEKDAICLSYFIADDQLDISASALPGDDPYFRYWFLSLLPLYDDEVSQKFWDANFSLRARHAFAKKWEVPPDFAVKTPAWRLPSLPLIEKAVRAFQRRWFPQIIKDKMNKDTTVMVTDSVLKFHVSDHREEFRRKYQEICWQREIKHSRFFGARRF